MINVTRIVLRPEKENKNRSLSVEVCDRYEIFDGIRGWIVVRGGATTITKSSMLADILLLKKIDDIELSDEEIKFFEEANEFINKKLKPKKEYAWIFNL